MPYRKSRHRHLSRPHLALMCTAVLSTLILDQSSALTSSSQVMSRLDRPLQDPFALDSSLHSRGVAGGASSAFTPPRPGFETSRQAGGPPVLAHATEAAAALPAADFSDPIPCIGLEQDLARWVGCAHGRAEVPIRTIYYVQVEDR